MAGLHEPALVLGVAPQTQIRVALHQQLRIDGAMWAVADRAAFTKGGMLENKRPRLSSMTRRTRLIQSRHSQPPRGLEDVPSVRVVTLSTLDFVLRQRVMLGQMKLRFNRTVTLETRTGCFARVHDKPGAAASGRDVQAAGPMAGLAPAQTRDTGILQSDPRVGARGENTANVGVALRARLVAHERCPRHLGRRAEVQRCRGTRNRQYYNGSPTEQTRRNSRASDSHREEGLEVMDQDTVALLPALCRGLKTVFDDMDTGLTGLCVFIVFVSAKRRKSLHPSDA